MDAPAPLRVFQHTDEYLVLSSNLHRVQLETLNRCLRTEKQRVYLRTSRLGRYEPEFWMEEDRPSFSRKIGVHEAYALAATSGDTGWYTETDISTFLKRGEGLIIASAMSDMGFIYEPRHQYWRHKTREDRVGVPERSRREVQGIPRIGNVTTPRGETYRLTSGFKGMLAYATSEEYSVRGSIFHLALDQYTKKGTPFLLEAEDVITRQQSGVLVTATHHGLSAPTKSRLGSFILPVFVAQEEFVRVQESLLTELERTTGL